eukprot:scaffold9427_cov175-Amphora_coffeaeformis.AAC.1
MKWFHSLIGSHFLLLLSLCTFRRTHATIHHVTAENRAKAPALATHRTLSQVSDTDLVCQLHINRVLPTDGRVEGDLDREFTTCSPWIDALGGIQGVYRLETPAWVLSHHRNELLRGVAVYLVIPNGSIAGDEIVIPSLPDVTVMVDPPSSPRRYRQLQGQRGAKKTVMLRIRGYDSEPDFTVQELRRYLLLDNLSARRQLERCSQGLVTMDASRYGVLDVPIQSNIEGLSNTEVMNLAESYVNDIILASDPQVDNIREWADFLIFVIPPGTGGWAAFATVSGKQSVFNNRWGGYLGALLHELGHNMGLDHAFENGKEYDGVTGYMGNVPTEVLTPQRCYNAHNHYKLQWFEDRVLEVDPEFPQIVTLAPFVQYDSAGRDEYIIVRVGNLYMQYNRAIDYNADSGEYPDTLVVVRERENLQGTDLLVGLDTGKEYREDDGNEQITVHVCNRISGGGAFGADILTVSVGYGRSLCNSRIPAQPAPVPPPAPSPVSPPPTPRPVAPSPPTPTSPRTLEPTRQVSQPTSAPSRGAPTPTENRRPTMAPTFISGDALDDGGLAGIQQYQASKQSSGLRGILAASLSLLVALLVIIVVYFKCCRTSKIPPDERSSVNKEKEADYDTEKASVHSGDSNSTVSSDESFETELAMDQSSKNPSRLTLETTGRSFAHSIATSCALAGIVDEEESLSDTPASMLAAAKRKATNMLLSTKVQATAPPRQTSAATGTVASNTGEKSSWLEWIGINGNSPSCDFLNNICGYTTATTSPTVVLQSKNKDGVLL